MIDIRSLKRNEEKFELVKHRRRMAPFLDEDSRDRRGIKKLGLAKFESASQSALHRVTLRLM